MKPTLALITLLILGLYVASLCDNWQFDTGDADNMRRVSCGHPCYAYVEAGQ